MKYETRRDQRGNLIGWKLKNLPKNIRKQASKERTFSRFTFLAPNSHNDIASLALNTD